MLKYISIFLSLIGVLLFSRAQSARVVSLVPSITQSIVLLEASDQLVGITSFCPALKNQNVEIVASAVDANVEKIVTLKPDVVFTSSLIKFQTVETFRNLGIKVVNLDYPQSYNEICSQFIEIALVVGRKELAEKIISEQDRRLQLLMEKQNKTEKPVVFVEIGAKPLFTVVPNTFMHDMIVYSGGKNLAEDLNKGTITRELVIVRDPEYIFIVTMGLVTKEEMVVWNRYANLRAVKTKNIHQLDAEKACTPTPINFVDSVEEMMHYMFP